GRVAGGTGWPRSRGGSRVFPSRRSRCGIYPALRRAPRVLNAFCTHRTRMKAVLKPTDPVAIARKPLLERLAAEIAASCPGVTRLGGQIVAALYLSEESRSMDDLSDELGRSKSNIFANLRSLEAAGIVVRQREAGARFDTFALRGKYPDVIIGAYFARLR